MESVNKFQEIKKMSKICEQFYLKKATKKYAILLVLPFEEISILPELSSPTHFRIQGGWSERYKRRRTEDGGLAKVLVSNIGYMKKLNKTSNAKYCQVTLFTESAPRPIQSICCDVCVSVSQCVCLFVPSPPMF